MSFPSIPGLGEGKPTLPPGIQSSVTREIVWGSLYTEGVDMTSSIPVVLNLSLPTKHPSSCCLDRIDLCVKYKFTDELCITCDTVICYKIYRPEKWKGGDKYPAVKDYDDIIDIRDEMIRRMAVPDANEDNGNNYMPYEWDIYWDMVRPQDEPSGEGDGWLNNGFTEVEAIRPVDSILQRHPSDTGSVEIESNQCNCIKWNSKSTFLLQLRDGTIINSWCGETHTVKNKASSVKSIKALGYQCVPNSCPVDYQWEVRAMDNSLIRSGNGENINYSTDLAGISLPRQYKVVFYPLCGGRKCKDPCTLQIN